MTDLVTAMQNAENMKFTENGALAYASSGSALLDCFAMCGAMRTRSQSEIRQLYERALTEDRAFAVKLAFYTRDIRGGLGERRTGRIMFRTLAERYPYLLGVNLPLLSEYGRWDDLLICLDTPLEGKAIQLAADQLKSDCGNMEEGKPVSLLAKWMPSVNASSIETVRNAKRIAKALSMREQQYRVTLSRLRAYLNITERCLSMKEMEKILYGEVSSNAMKRYHHAFLQNDGPRFSAYLEEVKEGKETIQGRVLFPYEIAEEYLYRGYRWKRDAAGAAVLEAQWKALPDLLERKQNVLVMADVSGSMYGRPLASSIGLALYFAERNEGIFHNRFLTFSNRPHLSEIKGDSLAEKFDSVASADWMMNTDLDRAFQLVLQAAMDAGASQEELPTSIVVITDMEIDACNARGRSVFTSATKQLFEARGYTMPQLVFWNVSARHNTFHARTDEENVRLLSGQSVHVFTTLLNSRNLTPYAFMKETLNAKRYAAITVPEN